MTVWNCYEWLPLVAPQVYMPRTLNFATPPAPNLEAEPRSMRARRNSSWSGWSAVYAEECLCQNRTQRPRACMTATEEMRDVEEGGEAREGKVFISIITKNTLLLIYTPY